MRESFAQRSAKVKQPRRMLFNELVPRFPAETPDGRFFDGNDRCRPRLAGKERHFAEPILRSKDRDVFFAASGAFKHDLNRPGLDKVKRISLVALREHCSSGRKRFFFQLAQNFCYVFAGEAREKWDRPYCVRKI